MKRTRDKLKLQQATDLPWSTLEFSSCLSRAHEVETRILDECRRNGYNPTDVFGIKLSLEEALVNACKHGNKLNPCKCVKVQYRITPQRADFTVEDQGEGFNPANLPDPTAQENLEMNHGRGILLMRAYMSSVVYNPQGNKVTLTKFNESYRPPEAALG